MGKECAGGQAGMVRVIVYCEGVTEEIFVNEILAPYFGDRGIYLVASQCGTGGVSKYSKIKKDIIRWCRQDKGRYVTSMIDYYGFPSDVPWEKTEISDLNGKISRFEQDMYEDIGEDNFIPNIMVHEFEALLFSDVRAFSCIGIFEKTINKLKTIRDQFSSPEHINGGFDTSPSHRIKNLLDTYSKPIEGRMIAKEIGINKMREECRHFDDWLKNIEKLVK